MKDGKAWQRGGSNRTGLPGMQCFDSSQCAASFQMMVAGALARSVLLMSHLLLEFI